MTTATTAAPAYAPQTEHPTAVRRLLPLFTAAPLLLLAGQLVHPEEPLEGAALQAVLREHPTAWRAAHLLLLAGTTALLPVLLLLAGRVRAAAPRLAALSAGLAVVGVSACAAVFGAATALTGAGQGDPATLSAFLDSVLGGPLVAVVALQVAGIVSVVLSAALLAASGQVSRGLAATLAIAFAVGFAAPEPLACLGTAVATVALTLTGRRLARA